MSEKETVKETKKDIEEKGTSDDYFKKTVLARQSINGKKYHKIFNFLNNSLNREYAPIVAICGRYGTGKSMTALEISRVLHNEIGVLKGDLEPKKQLVYTPLGFLESIKDSERKALIFDESGVNLNSLDFRSEFNRAVVDVVSTQRFRENVYIFVLGKVYKLSKSLRDVIDLRLLVNRGKGKPYVNATIFRPKYGAMNTTGSSRTSIYLNKVYKPKLPPKELREKYRKKELDFKTDLVTDRIRELKGENNKKNKNYVKF